jgi:hypothetical protein
VEDHPPLLLLRPREDAPVADVERRAKAVDTIAIPDPARES